MIQTTALRNEESTRRSFLRSSAHILERVIVDGTSCSSFEAGVITQKAQEVFGLGEYNTDVTLQPGQMIWRAILAIEPPGKLLDKCHFKQVHLTVHKIEEDTETLKTYGRSAKRAQQIMRICTEAMEQGTLLTQEDLAILLDCDVKTIGRDIRDSQKRLGILIPTRGTKLDIGPGITHREKAVELFIKGKDGVAIARELQHSLKAVERYIHTFCRVVHCQSEFKDNLKTALVVGVTVALVNKYLALRDRYWNTPSYRERLTEIEEVGTRFWVCQDSKKKPGRTARRRK
jgi:DNA-binding CsgD family transcriptional regulator